ncbi:SufE family protein [Avibacterium sp. 20-15]|uniref:SufE family protein n=1 Tax=unclassified Avibacterium TaxID=2685287 RepID=UPI002025D2BC|nr:MULTISPECIES: SufE family protein [unclassified Avibacterium]MCW9732011.1 SufE family protein [Avibacterium sp. 20-15]URL04193.1 SufE family protein [Avibacterium sp. 20-132]
MRTKIKNAKNWEDRYRFIIQSGKMLSRPDEETLAQMQPISGCEAKVWFKFEEKNDHTFLFNAFSEARIINGLLWLILQEINGKTAAQLQSFDLTAYFDELGIAQRLSHSRLNGLKQIEQIVRNLATCTN